MHEIREQLHWLATNGIPRWEPAIEDARTPPTISVAVVRSEGALPDVDSVEADLIRQVVERLETHVASIATDQLALFVDALDNARDELLAVLKGDPQELLDFDDPPEVGTVVPRPVIAMETADTKSAAKAQKSVDDSPLTAPETGGQGEHLVSIVDRDRHEPAHAERPQQRTLFDATPPAKLTLFEPGEAIEFRRDGKDLFGEIVALDDGRNVATVMLIPSGEALTVSQDELAKAHPDPLTPVPEPPAIVAHAVYDVEHAYDQLGHYVRVYGDERGPLEWLAAQGDQWLDRQLAARSTLTKARRIAEKNGWDWHDVLRMARQQMVRRE